MGVLMGSREAIEVLVTDKVSKRFGLTDWGEPDYETDVDLSYGIPDPVDLDDPERPYEEERELKALNADRWFRALAGGYELFYSPTGAVAAISVCELVPVAQRLRAIKSIEAVPQFKGGMEMAEYILPEALKAAGYRVERGDTWVRWARGRGRNVSKGTDFSLDEFDAVITEAEIDLDQRGGPAKSRSKKAKEEERATARAEHLQEGGQDPAPAVEEAPEEAIASAEDHFAERMPEAPEFDRHEIAGLTIEELAAKAEEEPSPDVKDVNTGAALITQSELERRASLAGYDDPRAYADDQELAKCDVCGRWGAWGEEVTPVDGAYYCEAHRAADLDDDLPPTEEEQAAIRQVEQEAALEATATPINGRAVIGLLRTDGDTQSREAVDQDAITEYAEAMTNYRGWGAFPEVRAVFDGKSYWVWDGHQRIAAFRQAYPNRPETEIPVELRPGDRRLAVLLSTGANADHGVRRSRADKQKAVTKLLKDEEWRLWSDAEIARHTHVDPKTVGNIRARLEANREIPDTLVRKTADGHSVNVPKREVKPLPARHNKPTPEPARVVYTAEAPNREEIPPKNFHEGDLLVNLYAPIIEAGFYLESYGEGISYRVRWAYDEEGDHRFGEWLTFAHAAADQGLRWWNAFPREKPEEAPAMRSIAPLPAIEDGPDGKGRQHGPTVEAPTPEPARPHGLGGYALPELPAMPTKEERIAAARELLELYRATLKSLAIYERLTGNFTATPAARRALEPMRDAAQRLLEYLGEVIEVEITDKGRARLEELK